MSRRNGDNGTSLVTKVIDHDDTLDTVQAQLVGSATNGIDGSYVKLVANQSVVGGVPIVIYVDVADGSTADIDTTITNKLMILDVVVEKRAGAGGASDTITVKNAANAITNAMSINVADQTIVRAGTIDDAQSTINAAGTLRVTRTKASANNVACQVRVIAVRVA
jgi:hypothetical protein